MKIFWTKESLHNLKDIEKFISLDNSAAAIKLIEKLISLTQDLISFPKKGRVVPELNINQIREIVYRNYRIVYFLRKNSINVLTIFESHKLLDKENLLNKSKTS